MTTGFTSAMIAFDNDIDIPHRKAQPQMYGYVPDDNGQRTRTYLCMIMISTLHNLSRSVACALLVAGSGKTMAFIFILGEMAVYLLYKAARGEYHYWPRLGGLLGVFTGEWRGSEEKKRRKKPERANKKGQKKRQTTNDKLRTNKLRTTNYERQTTNDCWIAGTLD